MNFIKLNNNIEASRMIIKSGYQFEKMKVATPVPMAPFGNYAMTNVPYNCNFEDEEYSLVERNYEDEDDRNVKKGKILSNVKVVVEKLPDDLVQKYLAKKPKNYEQMNFGKKISNSSGRYIVKRETIRVAKQYSAKKHNIQTKEFLKGLYNQNMQQYLMNTEMGDLATQMHEPQEYFSRVNHFTTDNSFGPNEMQYPVKMERNYQASDRLQQQQPIKVNNSYKEDSFVVRKDDFVKNPLLYMKQEISKKKQEKSISRRRNRKSFATKLCQRICPHCQKYVPHGDKATMKMQCNDCKSFTLYECKKCKKQVQNYNAIFHHLHYQCEARVAYKCVHCKYSVKRKAALALHIKRTHLNRILNSQKKGRSSEKGGHKAHQDLENKRYENLIVLKKQNEIQSEWYIDNAKKSDSRVDKNIGSTSPTKQISAVLDSNSTSVRKMSELYCTHCECKVHFDSSYSSKSDFYCRICSTDLIFKCLKCSSTCTTYDDMKHHLKKGCTVEETKKEENIRKRFYCPDCNYRSHFEGLVNNHYNKIHCFDMQEFYPDNLAQNNNENDFDYYYSEQDETGEL